MGKSGRKLLGSSLEQNTIELPFRGRYPTSGTIFNLGLENAVVVLAAAPDAWLDERYRVQIVAADRAMVTSEF